MRVLTLLLLWVLFLVPSAWGRSAARLLPAGDPWSSQVTALESPVLESEGRDVAVDARGNVYVTGTVNASTQAASGSDYLTVSYTRDGTLRWARTYDGPGHGEDRATAIAVDSTGDVVVTGFSQNAEQKYDFATLKYRGASGELLWEGVPGAMGGALRYDGPAHGDDRPGFISSTDYTHPLAVDGAGNVFVTGYSSNGSLLEFATVAYASTGAGLWEKRLGLASHDLYPTALAVDGTGDCYVTGFGLNKLPGYRAALVTMKYRGADGEQLWSEGRYGGDGYYVRPCGIVVNRARNAYVACRNQQQDGGYEYLTLKYRSDGTGFEWLREFRGPDIPEDKPTALALDPDGNVYVTGQSWNRTTYCYTTLKYAADGTPVWLNYDGFGNPAPDHPELRLVSNDYVGEPAGLVVDREGNIYLSGTEKLRSSPGGRRYHSAVFDPRGKQLWDSTHPAGTPADTSYATALALSPDGNLYVTGYSRPYCTTFGYPTAPPAAAAARSADSRSIALAWTDLNPNEAGYRIERKTGPDGEFRDQGVQLPPNQTSYVDTGLVAETRYSYRVRAAITGGFTPYSRLAEAAPLAAPTELTATLTAQGTVRLTWVDNSRYESGFKIERSPDGTGQSQFGEIATTDAVGTPNTPTGSGSYEDDRIVPNVTYTYRLRAFTAVPVGYSDYNSSPVTLVTLPAPANLTVTVPPAPAGGTRLDLGWDYAGSGQTGFEIERQKLRNDPPGGPDGAPAQIQLASNGQSGHFTYPDSGLESETTYEYRVRARLENTVSVFSASRQGTTLPPVPSPPTGVAGLALSTTEVLVSWNDSSSNEDGFNVYRKVRGSTAAPEPVGQVAANQETYRDGGLRNTLTYTYQVRAYNRGGESIAVDAIDLRPLPDLPPPPTGVSASSTPAPGGLNQLRIAWSAPSGPLTGFIIERKSGAGSFEVVETDAPVSPTTRAYTDQGLSPGTAYAYRVRCMNASGLSGPSAEAPGATLPFPPTAPSNLLVTVVSPTELALAWRDNSTNEGSFVLERRMDSGGFGVLATVAAGTTSY